MVLHLQHGIQVTTQHIPKEERNIYTKCYCVSKLEIWNGFGMCLPTVHLPRYVYKYIWVADLIAVRSIKFLFPQRWFDLKEIPISFPFHYMLWNNPTCIFFTYLFIHGLLNTTTTAYLHILTNICSTSE